MPLVLRLEELPGTLRLALDCLEQVDHAIKGVQRVLDLVRGPLEELLQDIGLDGKDPQLLPVVSRLGRRR